MCKKKVEKTVSGLDGVEKAEVSLADNNVTIVMKPGKTLTEEALKKAFEESDYEVTSFETVVEERKDEGDKKEDSKKEDPKKDDGTK